MFKSDDARPMDWENFETNKDSSQSKNDHSPIHSGSSQKKILCTTTHNNGGITETIFQCDYPNCIKIYTQKYRMEIHKRTHTGEKPYKCKVCDKGFTEKGNLKVHIRTHTGEKPFICSFQDCQKGFKAYGQLKDHTNKHLNLKQFPCQLCSSRFSRKSTLKLHILIHTGEKPHLCPYENCLRRFTEKSNMRKHCKVHEKNLKKKMQLSPNNILLITSRNCNISMQVQQPELQISQYSESFLSFPLFINKENEETLGSINPVDRILKRNLADYFS